MSTIRLTLFAITTFLAISTSSAQELRPPDPLFRATDVLEVRLVAPIKALLSERPEEEELPGAFHYIDSTGIAVEFDIQIRTRGNFRRNKTNCRFPPLRLNFKTSQTKDTLFHKQDKVKLVTHCQSSKTYEQTVFGEYLAYRILNVVTENSFDVRLLNVTYVDSETGEEVTQRPAIIIEHEDRLAKRIDKGVLDLPATNIRALDPDYSSVIWMYHYLIGNTDFSALRGPKGDSCCHNHVLFANEGEAIWSVPYDFDQSGIVDAPHAGPAPQFKIDKVTERLYRGRCLHNENVGDTIVLFQAKRTEVMALLSEIDMAAGWKVKSTKKFIDNFYKTLDSERRVQREFIKGCI